MTDSFELTAHPEHARQAFQDFSKLFSSWDWKNNATLGTLVQTCGQAPYLIRFLINNPSEIEFFYNNFDQANQPSSQDYKNELQTLLQQNDSIQTLKQFKYRHFLRLTACEISGVSTDVIYKQFSKLAQIIISHVAQIEFDALCEKHQIDPVNFPSFGIIAMGKLGSKELNYSSDVDLIGVYDFDDHSLSPSPHEFYCKLFRRLSQVLSSHDASGFLYRVDWDLRPEGPSGTLANSMKAMETYYQTFGEEWERQAFIRARVLYQNKNCGTDFLIMMHPFVYRTSFDETTLKNTWNMKAKIQTHLNEKSLDGFHVKLGTGGIRDIEFFAQGFQLLLGGIHKSLQNLDTIDALKELAYLKIIEGNIAQNLVQAYLFLRRIENALQMENEAQVHLVKDNSEFRLKVARRLGFDADTQTAISVLNERLSETKAIVAKYFKDHFGGVT